MFDDFDKGFNNARKSVNRGMAAMFIVKAIFWIAIIIGCVFVVKTCNAKGGVIPMGKDILGIERTVD